MHVHTCHSHDGRDTPRSMVQRAAGIGLDGLAITDHNTQAGVGEALEAGREFDEGFYQRLVLTKRIGGRWLLETLIDPQLFQGD